MIVLSPLIGQASGRLGSLVFVRGPRGGYVRSWVAPTETSTPERAAVWAAMTSVAAGWSALSDANKAAWQQFSIANPRSNRLGQMHPIGGRQEYIRANLIRSQATHLLLIIFTLVSVPPSTVPTAPTVVPALGYTTGTGALSVNLGASGGYSASKQAFVALWLSEPQAATRTAYYGAWTLTDAHIQPGSSTSYTVTVPVGHRPTSGQALFVRTRYLDELGNLHTPCVQRLIAP